MLPRQHFEAADTRHSQNFQNSQKRLTQRSDPKADADKQRGEQLGTGWERSSSCMSHRAWQDVPSIEYRSSIIQQAMKIAFAAHTGCYASARSAPEAKFLQNPQNCQNWRNSAESSKFPINFGLPMCSSSKIYFESRGGRDFSKVFIIRRSENPRGRLWRTVTIIHITHTHIALLNRILVVFG